MRLGLYSAIALVALPLMANAQSASQNLAQLEKAVRVQQWICTGIDDVRRKDVVDQGVRAVRPLLNDWRPAVVLLSGRA